MRRTKDEAEVTRQNILKAALIVFSRHGYDATRLEDIATEAQVTRGAVYHHFGGKVELYYEMIRQFSERVMQVVNDAIAEGGTTLELVRRMLVQTLLYVTKDDEARAVNEIILFKSPLTSELAAGIEQKKQGTRSLVGFLTDLFQQGIRRGELRADLDPRDAAVAALALQNGLIGLWLIDDHLFALEERVEAIVDIFVQGLIAEQ
jgi:TetR/AcrR family acrAB operon transcriptional repressor